MVGPWNVLRTSVVTHKMSRDNKIVPKVILSNDLAGGEGRSTRLRLQTGAFSGLCLLVINKALQRIGMDTEACVDRIRPKTDAMDLHAVFKP